MKHAGPQALQSLAPLLARLRDYPGMAERKPGIFYRKGQAFLDFHEDAAGLFADLKHRGDWLRVPVNNPAEWDDCLSRLHSSF